MKKILAIIIFTGILVVGMYYAAMYYWPISKGVRSGELIKFSNKGFAITTWEGEISQGYSSNSFSFSVEDKHKNVIYELQDLQGKYVKVNYIERFGTFFWWGKTTYFVTKVKQENSPHSFINLEKQDK